MSDTQQAVAELISQMIDGEGGYPAMKLEQHSARYQKLMLDIARDVLKLVMEIENETVAR